MSLYSTQQPYNPVYYIIWLNLPTCLPGQRGDVDYDHIESMDVELVNQHISDVIAMKEVNTPVYNMKVRPSL